MRARWPLTKRKHEMNEASERTQFDYLLNAMERAAQEAHPAKAGYAGKRKALFAYVRDLEARAAVPAVQPQEPVAVVRDLPGGGMGWLQWVSDELAAATPAGTKLYAAPQAEARQEQPDSVHLTEPKGEAATARDAARYRWLREKCTSQDEDEIDRAINALSAVSPNPKSSAEFDAAIDAALSSTPGDGGTGGVALPLHQVQSQKDADSEPSARHTLEKVQKTEVRLSDLGSGPEVTGGEDQ